MPFITNPYEHQIKMVDFGMEKLTKENLNGVAFLCEMGTGKTKAAIDLSRNLAWYMGVKSVLIICPLSIMGNPKAKPENQHGWVKEVNTHSKAEVRVIHGTRKKRLEILEEPQKSRLCFYVINFAGARILKKELKEKNFDVIICDESTNIKNGQSATAKACFDLGRAVRFRIIMTGTPITQGMLDIFSQYKFMDRGITFGTSFTAFRNKYFEPAVMKCPAGHVTNTQWHKDALKETEEGIEVFCKKCGESYKVAKKPWDLTEEEKKVQMSVWKWHPKKGALNVIKDKINSRAIFFTKEECLDLPPKVYETRIVELSKEEKKQYTQMEKLLFTEISGEPITAKALLDKLIRLSQITSGFSKTEHGEIVEIKKPSKLKELMSVIEEVGGKFIIWCRFKHDIRRISRELEKMGIDNVMFYSEIKERDKAIAKFTNDPECRGFIGQPASGGIGLNLTVASTVIYYSNTYSLMERLQSEDRAHRIGTKTKVLYIDLITKDTIDEAILDAIKNKKEISDFVVHGWWSKKLGKYGTLKIKEE